MPRDRKKKKNTRKIKRRLYVVCEGKKTEYNYFTQYISDCNIQSKLVDVQVLETPINTPKELILHIKKFRETETDELWAVFDRDGYTKHAEAFDTARANGVNTAFSSISFEYWILLHFEFTTSAFDKSADIIRLFKHKRHLPDYDKGDPAFYKKIKSKTTQAIQNAEKIRKIQVEANPGKKYSAINPYTNVDELLNSIKNVEKIDQFNT